jgi:hypothetical protein
MQRDINIGIAFLAAADFLVGFFRFLTEITVAADAILQSDQTTGGTFCVSGFYGFCFFYSFFFGFLYHVFYLSFLPSKALLCVPGVWQSDIEHA